MVSRSFKTNIIRLFSEFVFGCRIRWTAHAIKVHKCEFKKTLKSECDYVKVNSPSRKSGVFEIWNIWILSIFLLVVIFSSQQHHGQTIHHTENFVSNSLHCNMDILMEAARGQKHLCKAKKSMKELNYWKDFYIEVLSNLKNPLVDPNRFELWP